MLLLLLLLLFDAEREDTSRHSNLTLFRRGVTSTVFLYISVACTGPTLLTWLVLATSAGVSGKHRMTGIHHSLA